MRIEFYRDDSGRIYALVGEDIFYLPSWYYRHIEDIDSMREIFTVLILNGGKGKSGAGRSSIYLDSKGLKERAALTRVIEI